MKLIEWIIALILECFKGIGVVIGACLLFAFIAALIIIPIHICIIPIARRMSYNSAMDGAIDIYKHSYAYSTSWSSLERKVLKEVWS